MTAPFGVEFGVAVETLAVLEMMDQGVSVIKPPKPHPLLETYLVQTTPLLGVVWVKGVGPTIQNDNYGTATRAAVDRLAEQLAQKYGRGEKTDMLLEGSIWEEPQDWMNGLGSRERLYSYSWERTANSSLPQDLDSIFVGAVGHPGSEAGVVIEYVSSDHARGQAELDKQMADLL